MPPVVYPVLRFGIESANHDHQQLHERRHLLMSFKDVSTGNIFRIPDYQRGYSWGSTQLEDIWNDLEQLDDGQFHYTGVITVERPSLSEIAKWKDESPAFASLLIAPTDAHNFPDRPYYIVDGQQRLITLSMILAAIALKLGDDSALKNQIRNGYIARQFNGYIYPFLGYRVDMPSHRHLLKYVFGLEVSDEEQTIYTQNISTAMSFFRDQLSFLDNIQLEILVNKIENQLRFNYYEIDEKIHVSVLFETMNNRGKQLSKLELLKNRVLYLITTVISILPADRSILVNYINTCWQDVYVNLAKNQEETKALDDDEFLRNHWIMYFNQEYESGQRIRTSDFARDLLSKRFCTTRARSGELEGYVIHDYAKSLGKSSKHWYEINYPHHGVENYSTEISFWLSKIKRLRPKTFFRPIIMACLYNKCKEDDLLCILKAIERHEFILQGLIISRETANRPHFWRYANEVYTKPYISNSVADEIRKRVAKFYRLDKFKNYVDSLRGKRPDEPGGYQSWPFLYYFMCEYEYHLCTLAGKEFDYNITIEPILRSKSWDLVDEVKAWAPGNAIKARYMGCLGNIVAVKVRTNINESVDAGTAVKRSDMPQKGSLEWIRQYGLQSRRIPEYGFDYGSECEREVASWNAITPENLYNRSRSMLEYLAERWDVQIKSEIDYLTLVNRV